VQCVIEWDWHGCDAALHLSSSVWKSLAPCRASLGSEVRSRYELVQVEYRTKHSIIPPT